MAAEAGVKATAAPVAVMPETVRPLTLGQAAGAPTVSVKSLVSPVPNEVQASVAPFAKPVPRLRIRMPVVPCTAVVGTSSMTLTGAPVGEAVANCVHSLASYTKLWL